MKQITEHRINVRTHGDDECQRQTLFFIQKKTIQKKTNNNNRITKKKSNFEHNKKDTQGNRMAKNTQTHHWIEMNISLIEYDRTIVFRFRFVWFLRSFIYAKQSDSFNKNHRWSTQKKTKTISLSPNIFTDTESNFL